MRYLCTNPDCSRFARLVAGSQLTCPACGQRVLDERVMLKHGRSVQSIVATKGRAVRAPAPAPVPVPKREEESDLTRLRQPRRTWDEIKAAIPPELLAKELAGRSKFNVARDHGIALKTLDRLMQEYGIVIPQRQGKPIVAPAKEGTAVAEVMPDSLAPTMPPAKEEPPQDHFVGTNDMVPEGEKPAPPQQSDHLVGANKMIQPEPQGLRMHVARAGKPADILQRDLRAMLGALEAADGRYNLTVILEEAS